MQNKNIPEEQGRNSKLDFRFQAYSEIFLKWTTERTEIFASSEKKGWPCLKTSDLYETEIEDFINRTIKKNLRNTHGNERE